MNDTKRYTITLNFTAPAWIEAKSKRLLEELLNVVGKLVAPKGVTFYEYSIEEDPRPLNAENERFHTVIQYGQDPSGPRPIPVSEVKHQRTRHMLMNFALTGSQWERGHYLRLIINDDIRELDSVSEAELLRQPNFGRGSLALLKELLEEHGVTIGSKL